MDIEIEISESDLSRGMKETHKKISELKEKQKKKYQPKFEKQNKNRVGGKKQKRNLWDCNKGTSICVIEAPKRRKRAKLGKYSKK